MVASLVAATPLAVHLLRQKSQRDRAKGERSPWKDKTAGAAVTLSFSVVAASSHEFAVLSHDLHWKGDTGSILRSNAPMQRRATCTNLKTTCARPKA